MCYFLVEICTLKSQAPFITSLQTKVNDYIKTPSSCSSSTLHVSMTSAPQGYWQHRMKYVIPVIIIAPRMNWMTHWSIEDNEKGGDTFALIHQYVWDGTKFTSAVNIAPRMKPWIKRQWQGLGAIILPFHTPTRLHILSAFSSWRILLPQFLVCRRVNYNPIQAPQTPRPGENWYRWLRIESCPIGKTCRQGSGWLAPHDGQKRTPCNFPVAPFDTLETSQSRWGPAQPLRLESILSPKLSHCLILPQTQTGFKNLGDQLKSDPVHKVVWQGKFSNVDYFYYIDFFLSIDLVLSSTYRSVAPATHLLRFIDMLSSAPPLTAYTGPHCMYETNWLKIFLINMFSLFNCEKIVFKWNNNLVLCLTSQKKKRPCSWG